MRHQELVEKMTLEEKAAFLTGKMSGPQEAMLILE